MSADDDHDAICAELCLQFAPHTICDITMSPSITPSGPPSSPDTIQLSVFAPDADINDISGYLVYPVTACEYIFNGSAEFADILAQMPCSVIRPDERLPVLASITECDE